MQKKNKLLDSVSINYKVLSSFDLKMIALVTMVIDHIGCAFFPDNLWFRIIGRTAFILYAFMLVQGSFYTSNLNIYLKKIIIWAFLSEIPYDLVVNGKWFSLDSQNIFFTLLLGIIGISLFKKNKSHLNGLIFITGCLFGFFLKVDYSWYGVALIYGLYFFNENKSIQYLYIQGLSSLYAFCFFSAMQFFSFVGIFPLYFYNGKLGRKTGDIYYSFYAIHLILIYQIKLLL